jgi:hypothetical protein
MSNKRIRFFKESDKDISSVQEKLVEVNKAFLKVASHPDLLAIRDSHEAAVGTSDEDLDVLNFIVDEIGEVQHLLHCIHTTWENTLDEKEEEEPGPPPAAAATEEEKESTQTSNDGATRLSADETRPELPTEKEEGEVTVSA